MRAFNEGLFTTDVASLNEATLNRFDEYIKKSQPNAEQALKRLIDEGKVQTDIVAPIGVTQHRQSNTPFIVFGSNGKVKLRMDDQILSKNEIYLDHNWFTLHDNAIGQVSEKFGIPGRYLRQLGSGDQWERDLAAEILNQHSYNTNRTRVLIRAVGDEIRGILSDQYKRYDAKELVTSFLAAVQQQGGILVDGLMTDTKIFFETVHPEPIIVPTKKNGNIALTYGARLATSDFGDGALEMRTFFNQVVCNNKMVRESLLRKVHLGSRLPDNIQMSHRTYRLDTQTMASAINDITSQIYSPENIKNEAIAIQQASEKDVDAEKELKNMSRGAITKHEAEGVQRVLNRANPDDGVTGEGTLWKLVNAVTAYAREVKPDRQRELHEIAGGMLGKVKR